MVIPAALPGIVSGIGSIFGGIFGNSAKKKAIAAENERNDKNIALQREFAQSGIQWKVQDAKAAGIHPLAALGAQTHSFQPVQIDGALHASNPIGEAISASGQDLARAMDATRTAGQKADAYTKTVQDLTLQRMGLENTLLASQISKVRQPATGPAMPSATQRWLVDGQGETARNDSPTQRGALISSNPMERTISDPSRPYQEPGAVNELGFTRTPTGYAPVPSADAKSRIEDDMISQLSWHIRNRLPATFQTGGTPPFPAPKGKFWMFNPFKQEYQLYKKGVYNPFSDEHNR